MQTSLCLTCALIFLCVGHSRKYIFEYVSASSLGKCSLQYEVDLKVRYEKSLQYYFITVELIMLIYPLAYKVISSN